MKENLFIYLPTGKTNPSTTGKIINHSLSLVLYIITSHTSRHIHMSTNCVNETVSMLIENVNVHTNIDRCLCFLSLNYPMNIVLCTAI